jgi:hypothetical protein
MLRIIDGTMAVHKLIRIATIQKIPVLDTTREGWLPHYRKECFFVVAVGMKKWSAQHNGVDF